MLGVTYVEFYGIATGRGTEKLPQFVGIVGVYFNRVEMTSRLQPLGQTQGRIACECA